MHRFLVLFILVSTFACKRASNDIPTSDMLVNFDKEPSPSLSEMKDILAPSEFLAAANMSFAKKEYDGSKGALLSTKFKTLDELKELIHIEYYQSDPLSQQTLQFKPFVKLSHTTEYQEVSSILMKGVSEADFIKAGISGFWIRLQLAMDSPYFVFNRHSLLKVYNLSRRRGTVFGEGDMAFYDLAETMVNNISDHDLALMSGADLSEKGYLNTFNHITSQVFMTAIFSERLADYIADTHERRNMPELISGNFTPEQLSDLAKGPVDNYVDIINNEWGQELGKVLKNKYKITSKTQWTPELLAHFLNDIQRYYSWVFQISFKPYRITDEVLVTFSGKINSVMNEAPGLR